MTNDLLSFLFAKNGIIFYQSMIRVIDFQYDVLNDKIAAQLGRAPDDLECCSAPCHGLDSWSQLTYVKEILLVEYKKHSSRVICYRVCQLILCITTYG